MGTVHVEFKRRPWFLHPIRRYSVRITWAGCACWREVEMSDVDYGTLQRVIKEAGHRDHG